MSDKLRLGLFISGGGTTAEYIIKACKSGRLKGIEPACVIGNRRDCPGFEKARSHKLPTFFTERLKSTTDDQFADYILDGCSRFRVDIIGQYGWLPKTPMRVIEVYAGKMINQHPGPLDPPHLDFGGTGMYGRRVHAARLHFVRATERDFWTEATAQFVAPNYDEGGVICTKQVEIRPDDDTCSLQKRVLPEEHEVQVTALELFVTGKAQPLTRSERLIRPGEEQLLNLAKQNAAQLFPHG